MPLVVTGPDFSAIRLTTAWLPFCESAARLKLVSDDLDAVFIEATGDQEILVEALGSGGYQLSEFVQPGEIATIGPASRFYVAGQQELTTHHVAALPGSSPGSAQQSGGSKRPLSGSPRSAARRTSGGSAGGGGGGEGEGRKRHRQSGPAGASGAGPPHAAAAAVREGRARDPASIPDAPFHLMRVRHLADWANEGFLGVSLGDLVCGDMQWVLVSNYMLDFMWLLSACPDLRRGGKVVLVHGEKPGKGHHVRPGRPTLCEGHCQVCRLEKDRRDMEQYRATFGLPPDGVVVVAPRLPEFGVHHSKFVIVQYARGVRVIVFTANAIYSDNNNKSQGLWWQDFPLKDAQSPQTSQFEEDLFAYIRSLSLPLEAFRTAKQLISGHDFSGARGILIGSVPGYHRGEDLSKWGHMRLRVALESQPAWPEEFRGTPLLAQYSSVGKLDVNWLQNQFTRSMAAGRCGAAGNTALGMPAASAGGLQLVWPTGEEVRNSIEGWAAGSSIPGPTKNVTPDFLTSRYCRWGGEVCGRQRAMPHIKTFLRYRPPAGGGDAEVAWLLVGSHNLSKAAWGQLQKNDTQLCIWSYELSVLVTPATEAAYRSHRWHGFSCTAPPQQQAQQQQAPGAAAAAVSFVQWRRGMSQEAALVSAAGAGAGQQQLRVPLPIPYRLPPQRYEWGDKPWTVDGQWAGQDMLGCTIDTRVVRNYGWKDDQDWEAVMHEIHEQKQRKGGAGGGGQAIVLGQLAW